ncbi:MAG: alpha/beta hydrolase [Synechococcales cyanobacterium RM1_1_8]|nr:alpha/beta hydrolase [Synechococcales cyanobacterium RM1_1_8]
MADSPLLPSQAAPESGSSPEQEAIADGSVTDVAPAQAPKPPSGSALSRAFRSRGWQWLGLGITVPFLALNGLAAWQAHSLTKYRSFPEAQPPLFVQPPLQRLWAFATGVQVPRPENRYSPAELGLAFETYNLDLGGGERLEAWYVPADPGVLESGQSGSAEVPAQAQDPAQTPAQAKPPKQGMVLLFPAYAASKQTLLQEIKQFHRLGYDCFAVDFRGVGGSSGSDTTLGRREAEDVAAAVDYVRQRFDNPPLALYGRLMAAGTVLRAVAEYDLAPAALILEDPYANLYTLTEASVAAVGLPRSPTAQMLTLWGGVFQGGDPTAFDPITYAPAVQSSALVLYGSDGTSWTTLNDVVGLHSQLAGPKDILGLSSQSMLPLSMTAPGPWLERVGAFLDESLGNQ